MPPLPAYQTVQSFPAMPSSLVSLLGSAAVAVAAAGEGLMLVEPAAFNKQASLSGNFTHIRQTVYHVPTCNAVNPAFSNLPLGENQARKQTYTLVTLRAHTHTHTRTHTHAHTH